VGSVRGLIAYSKWVRDLVALYSFGCLLIEGGGEHDVSDSGLSRNDDLHMGRRGLGDLCGGEAIGGTADRKNAQSGPAVSSKDHLQSAQNRIAWKDSRVKRKRRSPALPNPRGWTARGHPFYADPLRFCADALPAGMDRKGA
jgi:hypothetical protein